MRILRRRKKEDKQELLPWTPIVDKEALHKKFLVPNVMDEGMFCERYALIVICSLDVALAPLLKLR